MLGDIVKILDEDGQEKASYVYNAWGNILSQSEDELSSINPLRYRGYVYDEDTTLYYLQTRYYDPTTGRFINADDTAYIGATGTILSVNIFTYCENNAIMFTDYNGQLLKEEKEAGRIFWKNWVVSTLKKKKWTYSATFLEHSLRDKPSNLWYNSSTALSKKIKKTNEFKNLVKKVRKKHKNKWVSNYTCSLVYNSGDL